MPIHRNAIREKPMPYDLPSRPPARFYFDRFVVSPAERVLECDGHPVQIGSRAFDILLTLLERPGEIIPHRALMARAWPSVTVEEANLRVHIANLRRALSASCGSRICIANVPGRGYSFITPVSVLATEGPAALSTIALGGGLTGASDARRLIGRDDDIKRVAELLLLNPLVSIVGAGGVGKTALASHLKCCLSEHFSGVYQLDLGLASSEADISGMLESARVFSESNAESGAAGAAGRPALIIIDTCEHAVDEVADWSARTIATWPANRILLTSREAIRSPYEHVYLLSSFELQPGADNDGTRTLGSPAVELFEQGARSGGYVNGLTGNDMSQVLSICRLLDGNPLAIEIISNRIATHGIRDIAFLVANPEWVLTQALRGTDVRHRSLAALIGWSYNSLEPDDQVVMQRLSTFPGSFTLSAAEDVAADEAIPPCDVQRTLSRLLERSLLSRSVDNGVASYKFTNLVRMFGQAAAVAAGGIKELDARHLDQLSASRSSFADFRSAVSNPSVNHP
jgi:predicted ATPase/DNA-binding winged helix-turn-helix (wHTH) protein